MKKHYRHETDCLNCGTELQGKYCHSCGQENLQIKESFGHMITHAISDYFHFDHQFFHTLKPLLFAPGKLTNEYMAGKRMQYLHPVKMYIFISLVFFVLFLGTKGEKQNTRDGVVEKKEIKQENKEQKGGLAEVADIKTVYDNDADSSLIQSTDSSYSEYLNKQKQLPEDKRDGFLLRYINKKAIAWNQHGGTNSKEMIREAIKHNAPKLMFFLLPMFALLLKIAFYRNKKFYVEHLIFSFHLHCFVFLFLTILMLLKIPMPDTWKSANAVIDIIALFAIMYYIYKALRTVYMRSRIRTVTKMIGLSFSYLIVFSVSFLFLVIISAIFAF